MTDGLDEDDPVQLVAGAPGAGDIEDDVRGACENEGVVDVLLDIGGRETRRGHGEHSHVLHSYSDDDMQPSRLAVLSSAEHPSPTSTRPTHKRPNIYDRNLNKTRTADISASALAFLFSEIVQYTQKRVSGINDLERRSASPPPPFSH